MANRTTASALYGDYCFRQPYLGRSAEEIRQQLAEAARSEIRRSLAARGALRHKACDWLWVREARG